MTTPKPASAPPADYARVMRNLLREYPMDTKVIDDYVTSLHSGIERLAASAQVREAEASNDRERVIDEMCKRASLGLSAGSTQIQEWAFRLARPAPEPVPVAQDVSDALDIVEMASSAVRGPYTSPELQEPLEQDHATLTKHIADHARRMAALVQAHSGARDVWHHWQGRAETAEASLAACRALVPKWRKLAVDADMSREWEADRANAIHGCAVELDAVLPLAGEA